MEERRTRWVLSFDASCGTCKQIAGAVAVASGERLEVLPLADPDVVRWRERAMGADRVRRPTLLRVTGTEPDVQVRAWTGARMCVQLTRRLGPRSTLRVLQGLGELRRQSSGHPLDRADEGAIGRGRFLRIGAGALVAAGLVLTGKSPAFAERAGAAAAEWVEQNKDRLPTTYEDIIAYPLTYRRAIHARLSPTAQRQLWMEHLSRYRAAHPDLDPRQRAVLSKAIATASKPATFESALAPDEALDRLGTIAIEAFGKQQARGLLATLGSVPSPASHCPTLPDACECSTQSDYCSVACRYDGNNTCLHTNKGCGTFWQYPCNGCC